MSDHTLTMHIDNGGGIYADGPAWRLNCHHKPGAYPVHDDNGEPDPGFEGVCWAQDWFREVELDEIAFVGDWPEVTPYPVPVRCVWSDGLTFEFDGGTVTP
jgi:hypothetical protein